MVTAFGVINTARIEPAETMSLSGASGFSQQVVTRPLKLLLEVEVINVDEEFLRELSSSGGSKVLLSPVKEFNFGGLERKVVPIDPPPLLTDAPKQEIDHW